MLSHRQVLASQCSRPQDTGISLQPLETGPWPAPLSPRRPFLATTQAVFERQLAALDRQLRKDRHPNRDLQPQKDQPL